MEVDSLLSGLSWLGLVPVDLTVLVRAATVRAQTNLKLPDAIHVASAMVAGAEGFLTNDRALLRASGLLPIHILDDVIAAESV
jgi:predicted nucleic acid-binding protein